MNNLGKINFGNSDFILNEQKKLKLNRDIKNTEQLRRFKLFNFKKKRCIRIIHKLWKSINIIQDD